MTIPVRANLHTPCDERGLIRLTCHQMSGCFPQGIVHIRDSVLVSAVDIVAFSNCINQISLDKEKSMLLSSFTASRPANMATLFKKPLSKHWGEQGERPLVGIHHLSPFSAFRSHISSPDLLATNLPILFFLVSDHLAKPLVSALETGWIFPLATSQSRE